MTFAAEPVLSRFQLTVSNFKVEGVGGSNVLFRLIQPHTHTHTRTAGPLPKPPPPAGPPMTAPGPGMMRPPVVSGKLCAQCKKNPSNPGRSWCEQCYVMKGSKS